MVSIKYSTIHFMINILTGTTIQALDDAGDQ